MIQSVQSLLRGAFSLIWMKNQTQFECPKKSIKTSTSHNGLLFHGLVLHNGRFSSVAHQKTKKCWIFSSAQSMYTAVVFLLNSNISWAQVPTKVARNDVYDVWNSIHQLNLNTRPSMSLSDAHFLFDQVAGEKQNPIRWDMYPSETSKLPLSDCPTINFQHPWLLVSNHIKPSKSSYLHKPRAAFSTIPSGPLGGTCAKAKADDL